jgi:hypothetical protein
MALEHEALTGRIIAAIEVHMRLRPVFVVSGPFTGLARSVLDSVLTPGWRTAINNPSPLPRDFGGLRSVISIIQPRVRVYRTYSLTRRQRSKPSERLPCDVLPAFPPSSFYRVRSRWLKPALGRRARSCSMDRIHKYPK